MDDSPAASTIVLLVEDNPDMREFVAGALKLLGHTAIEAGDAASALAMLAERPDVGLLLTDVQLPGGMNGAELARQARSTRPDIRVLFVSGYADEAIDAEELKRLGATMLAKPFRVRQLQARLDEVLGP